MIQVQKLIQIIFILPAKTKSSSRKGRIRRDTDHDDDDSESEHSADLFSERNQSRSKGKC